MRDNTVDLAFSKMNLATFLLTRIWVSQSEITYQLHKKILKFSESAKMIDLRFQLVLRTNTKRVVKHCMT